MKRAKAPKSKPQIKVTADSIAMENNNSKAADLLYLQQANQTLQNLNPEEQFSPRRILDLLRTILACLGEKDAYTHAHSIRVTEYASVLGLELQFTDRQLEELQIVAMLHDIGKVGIPDAILLKAAPLSKPEFEVMKSHPIRSAKILEKTNSPENIILGVRYHHERFDGLGYPNGLKGKDIPLLARIVLIADTFDAMTSTRPYRLALSNEVAFQELRKYAGTQFDLELVNAFIRSMSDPEKMRAVDRTFLRRI